jgi:PAS domain S-box-containing protein
MIGLTERDATIASLLLQSLPEVSLMVVGGDSRIVLAAGETPVSTRIGVREIQGRLASEVLAPREWSRYETLFRAALDGRSSRLEIEAADGGRWYQLDVEPFREPAGTVVGSVCLWREFTERKRLVEELEQTGQLMDLAHDAIIVREPITSAVTYWNREATKIYGYSAHEANGRVSHDLLATEFPQSREAVDDALLAQGRWEGELWHTRRDGQQILVSSRQALVRGGQDEPMAVIELNADITERKQAERALRAGERRLRGLIESAPDAMVIVDDAGAIVLVNRPAEELFGYPRAGLIGRPVDMLLPEERRQRHVGHREQFMARPRARPMGAALELHALRKDGTSFPVEVSLGPVQTEEGTLVSAAIRDITARVQAEGELRLRAEIMRNMAEGVVLVRTSDWTIAYANPKFEEMFGYAPGELTDRPIEVVHAPTDHDPGRVAAEIQAALASDGAWSGEVHNIKRDGSTFWCYLNASNFEHPEYGVVSVAIHTDITDRKAAEEESRRLSSIVAAAETLQRSILGPVDHQLPDGMAARYQPAVRPLEVGGDWYDVIKLPGERLGLIVGDCVGRGVEAAAVMGQLRSVLHSLMLQGKSPREALSDLDVFAERIPAAHGTTVFCALVDPAACTVRYTSAGHPPAVVTHRTGITELLENATSVPLAISGDDRKEATAKLTPACTVALYTDGLIERRGEALEDGFDRLRSVIAAHRDRPIQSLATVIIEEMQATRSEDDVALLLYRVPLADPPGFAISLPADPAKLAGLRKALREWLAGAGYPDHAGEVVLGICEACSNSIEHAYQFDARSLIDVRAQIEGSHLIATVSDKGRWKVPDPTANHRGRGLTLIKALMGGYTIETGNGTTVRLRKELSGGR